MSEQTNNLEQRVAELEGQVESLQGQLSVVEKRLGKLAKDKGIKEKKSASEELPRLSSDEVLNWLDTSYLMPRVATTSFIVAVALALRTASDSSIIDLQLGSFIGMLYALGLIAYG